MNNLPQKQESNEIIPNKHCVGLLAHHIYKIDNAPATYKYILDARYKSPRLIDLNQGAGRNRVNEIILGLFARTTYKVENIDTNFVRDNYYNDLVKHFSDITLQEIREALEAGVNGFYNDKTDGQLLGINVANLMTYTRLYMQDEKRKIAIKLIFEVPKQEPAKHQDVVKGLSSIKSFLEDKVEKEEKEKFKNKYKIFGKHELSEVAQEQNWFKIFDKIWLKQKTVLENGVRYISRYNRKLTQEDFIQYKANQRYKIKTIKNHK